MEIDDRFEEPVYPISVAARLLNISVHTLRMYEREDLIIPFKKETSHRLYSKADLERVTCIRRAINELKISIAGIKTISSLIPCWKILNCSEEDRKNCKAFDSHTNPCWSYKHKNNSCEEHECRLCTVYKDFSECKTIKESIKNFINPT
ncbi:MAG TPA: MerR family transcriptional regulator [Ignavibacteriaceae bacterium]|nr:MerR family transcriptional regulator [Ignavibacteriaceae bacterium]